VTYLPGLFCLKIFILFFVIKKSENILEDKRFAELFSDPNFQINTESDEFKLLNPVVQKVNEKKLKKPKQQAKVGVVIFNSF
jgi:hypothetical protein